MVDIGQNGGSGKKIPANPVTKLVWKAGVQGGFELLPLASLRARKSDEELRVPQRPDFHVLLFFEKGEGTHMVDFEAIPCPPNTLLHVSPHQVHAFGMLAGREATLLVFREELLPSDFIGTGASAALAEHVWPVAVTLPQEDARRLAELFATLHTFQAGSGTWHQPDAARYLALSIASFGYQSAIAGDVGYRDPGEHVAYYRFLALVESEFRTMHGAQGYARALVYSYRTLCRACQAATGLSPKALIDGRIMKEARRMLGYSQEPVYMIAEELGFSESTNFVKFFARLEGQTPEGFRTEWRGSIR